MPTHPTTSSDRRAELIERAQRLRRTALVGSIAFFVGLMGLVATHVTGVTATTGTHSVYTPAPATQQGNSGFFNNDSNSGYGQGGGLSSVPQYTSPMTRTRVS